MSLNQHNAPEMDTVSSVSKNRFFTGDKFLGKKVQTMVVKKACSRLAGGGG